MTGTLTGSSAADDSGRSTAETAGHNNRSGEATVGSVLLPGVAGLPALIHAFWDRDDERFGTVRRFYERENGGEIIDSYFTPLTRSSCALLVRRPAHEGASPSGAETARRHLFIWLGHRELATQVSDFLVVLWRTLWLARRNEGNVDSLVPPAARAVVADMLFTVAVFLLASVDALEHKCGAELSKQDRMKLRAAARDGDAELDKIERFLDKEAIRVTVRYYLVGLGVGAAVLAIPITAVHLSSLTDDVRQLLNVSLLAGGVGAVTSVMVRITRGQKLSVDTRQGVAVTLLAGGFRPLVGAVFGIVLYAFVIGGFIPMEIADEKHHFFAGLAFLAGFSERWAQDTIVRSAPIAPSPATRRGADEADTSTVTQ